MRPGLEAEVAVDQHDVDQVEGLARLYLRVADVWLEQELLELFCRVHHEVNRFSIDQQSVLVHRLHSAEPTFLIASTKSRKAFSEKVDPRKSLTIRNFIRPGFCGEN